MAGRIDPPTREVIRITLTTRTTNMEKTIVVDSIADRYSEDGCRIAAYPYALEGLKAGTLVRFGARWYRLEHSEELIRMVHERQLKVVGDILPLGIFSAVRFKARTGKATAVDLPVLLKANTGPRGLVSYSIDFGSILGATGYECFSFCVTLEHVTKTPKADGIWLNAGSDTYDGLYMHVQQLEACVAEACKYSPFLGLQAFIAKQLVAGTVSHRLDSELGTATYVYRVEINGSYYTAGATVTTEEVTLAASIESLASTISGRLNYWHKEAVGDLC